MKISNYKLLLLTTFLGIFSVKAATKDLGTGYVDLGTFSPPDNGGQFVEVKITSGLINIAARLIEQAEPEAAKLLRGIKLVRVNVIGLSKNNSTEISDRVKTIRSELEHDGWERVVAVREKKDDIGVYLKLRGDEAVEGVVVTVIEGNSEAVLVNVVGDIRPEQIAMIGERLHIDSLEKLGEKIR